LKITAHIFDRRRFKQSSEFIESGNLEDLLRSKRIWLGGAVLLAPRLAPAEADFRTLRPACGWTRRKTMCRAAGAFAGAAGAIFSAGGSLDARFGHPDINWGGCITIARNTGRRRTGC